MDCEMPILDGFGATAAIRDLPGERAATPVVAMTANTGTADESACLAAGMNGHVPKPVTTEALKNAFAEHVPGWVDRAR